MTSQKLEMTDPLENVTIKSLKNCTCEEFYKNYNSVELYFTG